MILFLLYYALIALVLFFVLPDAVCFAEQWHTFYWDAAHCREVIADQGLWSLISDFFTQFLATRWSASLLIALPTALMACLVQSLLRQACRRRWPAARPLWAQLTAVCLTLAGCVLMLWPDEGDRFKGQMCLVADEDWPTIISQSEGRTVSNLLEQNILNMALAEMELLPIRIKQQPCRDVNSLFVLEISSPYVAALLADVYWTMGEISMSQMYAFEANEKMQDLSPRLLKRLALTNIVFGHYEVARKYLRWLDKTLFYSDWAQHYITMLDDEAVMNDPVLRLKRGCIPLENVFPSAQSVAYDMQQIIEHNPEHHASAQYLDALKKIYNMN